MAMIWSSYRFMLSWLDPLVAGVTCEGPVSHAKNPPTKSKAVIKIKAATLNNAQCVPRKAFAVSSRTFICSPEAVVITCFAILILFERFSNAA